MFTETQLEKATNYWGKEVFDRIAQHAKVYADKWGLTDVRFYDSYSMNAIFYCSSKTYGECVLKIGGDDQDKEFVWEHNILQEYNGSQYIRMHASDIDLEKRKKVMLLERVSPGDELSCEPSLDKRLAVFSELFKKMHVQPANIAIYKKYSEGVDDNLNTISKRMECRDLSEHMAKARDIFVTIASTYTQEVLLHGDLQYHNILKRDDETYAIIDPQGRIGDPIFDIPRYLLVECYNMSEDHRDEQMNYIIEYLAKSLKIPSKIIRQCFYIEITSFECWCASVGDYDINHVTFAEKIMTAE